MATKLQLTSSNTANSSQTLSQAAKASDFFVSFPSDLEHTIEFLLSDNESLAILSQAVQPTPRNDPLVRRINLVFAANTDSSLKAKLLIESNTIELHPTLKGRPIEEILPYVLFELCNASVKDEVDTILRQAPLQDTDAFVEQIERLEYSSAQKTHALVSKWILQQKCPHETPYGNVHNNFKDHYLLQQLVGHSESIAVRYSGILDPHAEAFKGTWPCAVSPEASPILQMILEMKSVLQNPFSEQDRAKAQLRIDSLLQRIERMERDHPDAKEVLSLLTNARFAAKT